jgi:hypothetical protein
VGGKRQAGAWRAQPCDLVPWPGRADNSTLNMNYGASSSMLLSVTDSQSKPLEAHTYDNQGRGLSSNRANGVDSVTLTYP